MKWKKTRRISISCMHTEYILCIHMNDSIVVRPVFLFTAHSSHTSHKKAQRSSWKMLQRSSGKYRWAHGKWSRILLENWKKFFIKAQIKITKCVCDFTAARLQSACKWIMVSYEYFLLKTHTMHSPCTLLRTHATVTKKSSALIPINVIYSLAWKFNVHRTLVLGSITCWMGINNENRNFDEKILLFSNGHYWLISLFLFSFLKIDLWRHTILFSYCWYSSYIFQLLSSYYAFLLCRFKKKRAPYRHYCINISSCGQNLRLTTNIHCVWFRKICYSMSIWIKCFWAAKLNSLE